MGIQMKVILQAHVRSLGQKGEIKEVSPGYFQNFLNPRKLAVPATEGQVQKMKVQQEKSTEKLENMRESAQAIQTKLMGKSIELKVKCSESGKLYSSIHTKEIQDAIQSQLQVEIPEKNIVLEEPIKHLGAFVAKLKLHQDLNADLIIHVLAL